MKAPTKSLMLFSILMLALNATANADQNFTLSGVSYSTKGSLIACAHATYVARENANFACRQKFESCESIAERSVNVWYEDEKTFCKAEATYRGLDSPGENEPWKCYLVTRGQIIKTYTLFKSRGRSIVTLSELHSLKKTQELLKRLVESGKCTTEELY